MNSPAKHARVFALSLIAVALLGGAGALVLRNADIADTDEEFFPDPNERTDHRMRLIAQAIDSFLVNHRRLPDSLPELLHPPNRVDRTAQYPMSDAWGHVFWYTMEEGLYSLRSAGEDGVINTQDDIAIDGRGPGLERQELR